MLRLPLEVRDIFEQWLAVHYPDKAAHVMSLVRALRGGKAYDSTWGKRMSGTGPYAWITARRFETAMTRNGFAQTRTKLRTDLFSPPGLPGEQLSLL